MNLPKEQFLRTARLAKLAGDPENLLDLTVMLKFADDLSLVAACQQEQPVHPPFATREDVPFPGLTREQAMQNAGPDGQITVPSAFSQE